MKLLFVDFDGVLHSTDAGEVEYQGADLRYSGRWLFSQLFLLEDLLLRCADVSLVISSSWQSCYSLNELKEFLGDAGHRVIGTTRKLFPAHCMVANRYEECRAVAVALQATQWAMVDDHVGIVWGQHVPTGEELARVVFCDPAVGLTPAVVDILARKLSPPSK